MTYSSYHNLGYTYATQCHLASVSRHVLPPMCSFCIHEVSLEMLFIDICPYLLLLIFGWYYPNKYTGNVHGVSQNSQKKNRRKKEHTKYTVQNHGKCYTIAQVSMTTKVKLLLCRAKSWWSKDQFTPLEYFFSQHTCFPEVIHACLETNTKTQVHTKMRQSS